MSSRGGGESIPTGIYWFRVSWERARSGYVADLDHDPDAPFGLLGWLHRAITEHAARTPAERAAVADRAAQLPGEPGGSTAAAGGFKRTLVLEAAVVDELEAAILTDRRKLGRVVSRSEFVRHAALAAADRSEQRLGRALPPAPLRLPNRPVRAPIRST
jgi:hypothetical protein